MKRSVSRIAFLLLALYLVSFFTFAFVAAQNHLTNPDLDNSDFTQVARDQVATGAEKTTTIGERLLKITFPQEGLNEATKLGITKILLTFLVIIIIFAISEALPFLSGKTGLQWTFSIIVGVLAFIFVKPEEIKVILTNYQALGIAMTSIIPLVVLLVFTYELRNKNPAVAVIANRVIFFFFFVYLMYEWLTLAFTESKEAPVLAWAYPASALVSLVWMLAEGRITHWMRKGKRQVELEEAESKVNSQIALAKLDAKRFKELAKSSTESGGSGI